MKPVILVTLGAYLPGYKAGGPLRSIANLVAHLGGSYDFRILTTDRDLGDERPYPDVSIGEWHEVEGAEVLYLPPEARGLSAITKRIAATPHDLLYVNALFSPAFGMRPMLARRIARGPRRPLVVAPRGVFSEGALSIKSWRKRAFLAAGRATGFFLDATWQASSAYEAADIRRALGSRVRVRVASDLPVAPTAVEVPRDPDPRPSVIFLSRISPMKNLFFAIDVLARTTKPVRFSIHGPIEDAAYWACCRSALAALPDHVEVVIGGPATPDRVPSLLARHDLMFLPSLGENFGHAIAEALAVGTPVLISDRTPWRGLAAEGAGHDLSLDDPAAFAARIDALSNDRGGDGSKKLSEIRAAYVRLARVEEEIAANRVLFDEALRARSARSAR